MHSNRYVKKYEFEEIWIKYLGLVILENQVEINSIKVLRVCK